MHMTCVYTYTCMQIHTYGKQNACRILHRKTPRQSGPSKARPGRDRIQCRLHADQQGLGNGVLGGACRFNEGVYIYIYIQIFN